VGAGLPTAGCPPYWGRWSADCTKAAALFGDLPGHGAAGRCQSQGKVAGIVTRLGMSPHLTVECNKLGGASIVVFKARKEAVTFHDFEGQMYDFPYLMENWSWSLDCERNTWRN